MTQLEKKSINLLGVDRSLMNNIPLFVNLDSVGVTAVTSSTFFAWSYYINTPFDMLQSWLMPGRIYRLKSKIQF